MKDFLDFIIMCTFVYTNTNTNKFTFSRGFIYIFTVYNTLSAYDLYMYINIVFIFVRMDVCINFIITRATAHFLYVYIQHYS